MAVSLTEEEFLHLILAFRRSAGPRDSDTYRAWKAAICRQLRWTPEHFENRMDQAEELRS